MIQIEKNYAESLKNESEKHKSGKKKVIPFSSFVLLKNMFSSERISCCLAENNTRNETGGKMFKNPVKMSLSFSFSKVVKKLLYFFGEKKREKNARLAPLAGKEKMRQ